MPNYTKLQRNHFHTRFNIAKADWKKFQCILDKIPEKQLSNNINKEAAKLQKTIIVAANTAIPHYKNRRSYKYSHWWNNELKNIRNTKQKLFNYFKKHPTSENRIAYKKANALFKRKSKIAKRESFLTSPVKSTPIHH